MIVTLIDNCGARMLVRYNHDQMTSYLKLYEIHQSYVVRELNLINNRLTWILTIHGFLYAVYGLTLQKQLDVTSSVSFIANYSNCVSMPVFYALASSEFFLAVISLVGITISIAGYISIKAACDAMGVVADVFIKNVKAHEAGALDEKTGSIDFYSKFGYYFPHMLGGGKPANNKPGNNASLWIPRVLACSWMAAILSIIITCAFNLHWLCKFTGTYQIYRLLI